MVFTHVPHLVVGTQDTETIFYPCLLWRLGPPLPRIQKGRAGQDWCWPSHLGSAGFSRLLLVSSLVESIIFFQTSVPRVWRWALGMPSGLVTFGL